IYVFPLPHIRVCILGYKIFGKYLSQQRRGATDDFTALVVKDLKDNGLFIADNLLKSFRNQRPQRPRSPVERRMELADLRGEDDVARLSLPFYMSNIVTDMHMHIIGC